jgi:hypothetical protein
MRKNSTLTVADLHNIVTDNFAPDIKKLAHEIGPILITLSRCVQSERTLSRVTALRHYTTRTVTPR